MLVGISRGMAEGSVGFEGARSKEYVFGASRAPVQLCWVPLGRWDGGKAVEVVQEQVLAKEVLGGEGAAAARSGAPREIS